MDIDTRMETDWSNPMVQVIVVDKLTKESEVTYLDGTICVDGLGSKWCVYVSTPGHHRKTDDLKVIGEAMIEGNVKRTEIPDVDPENAPGKP